MERSEHHGPVEVTLNVFVPLFPAASDAVTVITFAPSWRTIPGALHVFTPEQVPLPPRSFVQVTFFTPTLSEAVPDMDCFRLFVVQVAPDVGYANVTVGFVTSPYVIVRFGGASCTDASVAVTVITFAPSWRAIPGALRVFTPEHVPFPPRSFVQVTLFTPTLSEAVPDIDCLRPFVVQVAPEVGYANFTVGFVISPYVIVSLAVPLFPDASVAVTVITFAPIWSTIPGALHVLTPVHVPLPPRSFDHLTFVTPMLSEATPDIDCVRLVVK
jgi:hypothetical protein